MNSPLGRPNWNQDFRSLPFWLNTCTRLFQRSATNRRPLLSMASACGTSNWFGAKPWLPHCLRNLPSGPNFMMRALPRPASWPSPTKMLPLDATSTAFGSLNSLVPAPATPAVPSVSSSLPSGLNLKTWPPLPLATRASVIQILSLASMKKPCGKLNIPPPKARRRLPCESNSMIGSSVLVAQLLAPQRSATQIWPLLSVATALVEPITRPSGSFRKPASARYGLA